MIEPKKCIKILGFMLQDDLKTDREINKISSQLHNRINNIRSLTKYTTFSTRLKFLNAYVIGKLNYMVPMYSIADLVNLNKLHKIITTAGRAAIGSYCHKKSIKYILNKCKWLDIQNLIYYSSISLIHKTLINNTPFNIFNLFRDIKNRRITQDITTKYIPKTVKFSKFFIYKYIKEYNLLDKYIKEKSINQFKKELKTILMYRPISDTHD